MRETGDARTPDADVIGRYRAVYDERMASFEEAASGCGVPFEESESQPRSRRLEGPWACRNCASSLRRGWVSPACERCRTGEGMESFFISLRCPKSCYFCFNPNQERFDWAQRNLRDVAGELDDALRRGESYDFVAVTGGEPLLHPVELLLAIRAARRNFPHSHIRLYTSGAGADEDAIRGLAEAGLDEIRFSVKLDDPPERRRRVMELIGFAAGIVDAVVEMPVEPGSVDETKKLMAELDVAGVRGINLLELGFPLRNAEEFTRRGFLLRRKPYQVLHDYWYAGGLPVAGSEAGALELLRWADAVGLGMGVHYCSLDNKNSGQIYRQNLAFAENAEVRVALPFCEQDPEDFFLKSIKVFGGDSSEIAAWLESEGVPFRRAVAAIGNEEVDMVEFRPEALARTRTMFPLAAYGRSVYVLGEPACGPTLQELDFEIL